MPDREYESSTVRVRTTKNITARLNVVPAPGPANISAGMMRKVGINAMPNKPIKKKSPLGQRAELLVFKFGHFIRFFFIFREFIFQP